MRAYICTCPSVFVLPRLLLYMSVLSCLHESDLSYQGTNILCLHHTMQSVIIIIKNKPKQNPSRYEISVKIRCYFCQFWASSEVLYSRMFVPDKVLLFPGTWVLFDVWRFFNLVFFFKVMDSFFLLLVLIVLGIVVFSLRNPTYLFNLPW